MWKPIETLTERCSCTDYLVATRGGHVHLLWWVEDDKEWLGDSDREGPFPADEVEYWFDFPLPPNAQ